MKGNGMQIPTIFLIFCLSVFISKIVYADEITKDVQLKLNSLGFDSGSPDGIFGSKTERALKRFYESQGGEFDGTLDQNELTDLKTATSVSNSKLVNAAVNACRAEIFTDRLVSERYVQRVSKAHQFACVFFGPLDAPLEIWIFKRDSDAYEELIEKWCDRRKALDMSFNHCSDSQIGSGSNAVAWSPGRGSQFLFYQLNLKTHEMSHNNQSPEYVAVHEYFHAWQKTKIGVMKSSNHDLSNIKLGRLKDGSRPWFNEGSAQYLSIYLWHKHKKMIGAFNDIMDDTFKDSASHIHPDLKVKSLRYLPWNKGGMHSYNISTWAMAYLINKVELRGYLGIYDDLAEMSFEKAFEKNYGFTTSEFESDFAKFISNSSRQERSAILGN
jgi:hypothetical protein